LKALALNATALTATMLMPGLAHAQAAPADAATVAPQGETGTGDIVVTAQRREQKLNDVGIAVSVISAKDLRALNINNATDIVRAIPNLKYNAYGSSQVVFNIRGVSQNDYGDQQEPPVAVYQDDSYAASITTASFPIFDLARTEALRGHRARCSAATPRAARCSSFPTSRATNSAAMSRPRPAASTSRYSKAR
jgi:iron complex outermembrane receptor protein